MSFKITLLKADITTLQVDAIVNAANAQLRQGGGVCGAIFKAAGSAELQRECDLCGGCPTGDAVVTGAYRITNVRSIIHAVGPIVLARNVTEANQRDLSTCYARALDLAKENGLRTIVCLLWFARLYDCSRPFRAFPPPSTVTPWTKPLRLHLEQSTIGS